MMIKTDSKNTAPVFTMKQVCDATGLSYETLKYYCRQGLVPQVGRDEHNYRVFTQGHIDWIKSLHCLRDCGLTIEEMRRYTELCAGGKPTIPQRQKILQQKLEVLHQQRQKLDDNIAYIRKKQAYYRDVASGKLPYTSFLFIT